jgi:hypothetical protein
MEDVRSPFVINAFYKAGNDEADWRFERGALPVTDMTPVFGDFLFEDITCRDVSYGAGFFLGLPESMLQKVTLRNVTVSYRSDAQAGEMAMTAWRENFLRAGFVCENLRTLQLEHVVFENEPDKKFILRNVLEVIE